MITVTPAYSVMKSVVDNNITGDAAIRRDEAFTAATDLQSQADVNVLIDGTIFARIKPRLQAPHLTFFEKTYRIDDSVTGLSKYSHTESLRWVAKSESHARRVIIISDNTTDYATIICDRITAVTPDEFIKKVTKAENDLQTRKYSSLEDSLTAAFF